MENTNHLSQYGRDVILLERGVSGGTLDLRADKLLLHNPEKL